MAEKQPPVFRRSTQQGRGKEPARIDYHSANTGRTMRTKPQRLVYKPDGAGDSTRSHAAAPNRPVYDYDRAVPVRRKAPGRMDFSNASRTRASEVKQAARGSLGPDGLPRRRQTQAAPFVNTAVRVDAEKDAYRAAVPTAAPRLAAARRSEPLRRTGATKRRASSAWDRPAWHATPEQEVAVKPRAAAYDQAKDATSAASFKEPGQVKKKAGFFARWLQERRKKKEYRQNHPPTPAQLRRQKLRRSVLTGLGVTAVLAAGCVATALMLFKIKTVQVVQPEGGTAYTNEQILAAFATPAGENIFSFDPGQSAANIATALPYLETVEVRRQLPDTVTITVSAATDTYAVASEYGGYTVLSGQLKVLRAAASDDAQAAALVQILGAQAVAPQPGQALALDSADKLSALEQIIQQVNATGLLPITQIDLSDTLELSVVYAGRIRVLLGTANDLAYKVNWAWRLVTPQEDNSLPDTAQGTLDVSRRNSEGRGQATWQSGAI